VEVDCWLYSLQVYQDPISFQEKKQEQRLAHIKMPAGYLQGWKTRNEGGKPSNWITKALSHPDQSQRRVDPTQRG
jgi:hypothetical protein